MNIYMNEKYQVILIITFSEDWLIHGGDSDIRTKQYESCYIRINLVFGEGIEMEILRKRENL